MHDDVAAAIGESERYTQEVLKPHPQFLAPLRGHEEEHEAAASGPQQLASEGASAASGLVDIIESRVRDALRQRSLILLGLVKQMAKFFQRSPCFRAVLFVLIFH